jgi:hypothetical protein
MEIDLHAKGVDQRLIELALAAASAVNVSPKYISEHMGLPLSEHRSGLMAQTAAKAAWPGMTWNAGRLVGEIPSAYTDSPFPLQYYFEISRDGEVTLSPGLAENLCNEPYYAVRRGNR